jgi:hypothetical protein
MASGIDLLAKELCEDYKIPVSEYPANWNDFSQPCKIKYNKIGKKYNALAGHKRNRLMAIDSDLLIAIWDGKSAGTNNMIKEMSDLKKTTHYSLSIDIHVNLLYYSDQKSQSLTTAS